MGGDTAAVGACAAVTGGACLLLGVAIGAAVNTATYALQDGCHDLKGYLTNAGIGAASHLCGLLFLQAVGTEITTVPYKGTGPAMTDLLGGQVDLLCDQTTSTTPMIKSGKVKVYGLTAPKRLASLPDVPTLDEQGLKGYDANTNGGFLAPAGTPKAIVDKLNAEINAALKLPDVRAKLEAAGIEVQGGTPQAYAALIKSDLAKWGKVVKAA